MKQVASGLIFWAMLLSNTSVMTGCTQKESSMGSTTDAYLNDAANSDALMNPDSRIDLGGADASISAPIAIDNPTELRGPDIEGVVIQPALAEHPESGLWLAFTYMADVGGGIFLQRYSNDGERIGDAQNIATNDGVLHNEPAICALSNGGVAVVWSVDAQSEPDGTLQIRHRVIGADGQPMTDSDAIVETDMPGKHWLGSVACDDAGHYLIVGVRTQSNDSFGVFAQLYQGDQRALNEGYAINDDEPGNQAYPVASFFKNRDREGWVVAYEDSQIEPAESKTIFARFLDASGSPSSEKFQVSASGVKVSHPHVTPRNTDSSEILISATLNNDTIALFYIDAETEEVQTRLVTDRNANYQVSAVAFGDDEWMTFIRRVGDTTQALISRFNVATGDQELHSILEGSIPPYQTAIAAGVDHLTTVFTERLDTHSFSLRVHRFEATTGE